MEFWKLFENLEFWKLNLRIGVLEIKFEKKIGILKIIWELKFWKLNLKIGVLEIKFGRNWNFEN